MRHILCFLVIGAVILGGGVAFAAMNTEDYGVDPHTQTYAMEGILSAFVKSWSDADLNGILTPAQLGALRDLVQELADGKNLFTVAVVGFTFDASGNAKYFLDGEERILNFSSDDFDLLFGNSVDLDALSDYLIPDGAGGYYFVSVRNLSAGGGGGGGCSALPFGAAILFMIPALALLKRGKR